jgi:hypothetical protein
MYYIQWADCAPWRGSAYTHSPGDWRQMRDTVNSTAPSRSRGEHSPSKPGRELSCAAWVPMSFVAIVSTARRTARVPALKHGLFSISIAVARDSGTCLSTRKSSWQVEWGRQLVSSWGSTVSNASWCCGTALFCTLTRYTCARPWGANDRLNRYLEYRKYIWSAGWCN